MSAGPSASCAEPQNRIVAGLLTRTNAYLSPGIELLGGFVIGSYRHMMILVVSGNGETAVGPVPQHRAKDCTM